jgi:hypothetical protein
MEAEGRLLHKDWSRYDTGHVVFRPKQMTVDELAAGYAWCYRRLVSHRSIWRRRPRDAAAILPYLAMSYLYKRSNPLWHIMIRRQWTGLVWRPLVESSRRRHLRFRARLAAEGSTVKGSPGIVVSAGVKGFILNRQSVCFLAKAMRDLPADATTASQTDSIENLDRCRWRPDAG